MVIWLMRTGRVTWIISLFRSLNLSDLFVRLRQKGLLLRLMNTQRR
jgi:hypothetical protein